jgi:acid phosphatase type 7
MQFGRAFVILALFAALALHAQESATQSTRRGPGPEDISTDNLISQPGPAFRVPQSQISRHSKLIVFGDQRFTDPTNTMVTNPKIRQWLVQKIAAEHPDAILMNGDVPYSGDVENDYAVYRSETRIWRDEHLNVYPALGNHEFHGDPNQALEHWWTAFPEMRNRRWYSVELGKSIYTIALDSDASLAKGSNQLNWLNAQLMNLPKTTRFVFISLHHPPVADFQTRINVSHNPRPNEIGLRDDLEALAPQLQAKIIVSAGHIHNYERFSRSDVTYLVTGGGAAKPVEVERKPEDLYQDTSFPNYDFVEFVLDGDTMEGKMYRVADPMADTPTWEVKDTFTIHAK